VRMKFSIRWVRSPCLHNRNRENDNRNIKMNFVKSKIIFIWMLSILSATSLSALAGSALNLNGESAPQEKSRFETLSSPAAVASASCFEKQNTPPQRKLT
jgi:hypothetical protein